MKQILLMIAVVECGESKEERAAMEEEKAAMAAAEAKLIRDPIVEKKPPGELTKADLARSHHACLDRHRNHRRGRG